MIAPKPHVAALAAYPLADLSLAPGVKPVMLAQNESAYPPSPKALAAAEAALADAMLYPDSGWTALRAAIAESYGIPARDVLCSNGSMELIVALIGAYAGPGDEVLSTQYGYALFRTATMMAGASYVAAPEPEMRVSVADVLAHVTARTRVVCIANPGNPTGSRIPRADLLTLREGLPADVLLLIDEAYGEFADGLDPPMFDLVARGDTVVSRTLSKAYGLAGMRIGWGLFPPEIGVEVRKLLIPGSVSGVAQAMGAAAVSDRAYMADVVRKTAEVRDGFAAKLAGAGFDARGSMTNFVLVRFADSEAAARAEVFLRAEGILVRAMGAYRLPECLRVSIGLAEDMARVAKLFASWKAGEGGG